jgi:hypothetical protein
MTEQNAEQPKGQEKKLKDKPVQEDFTMESGPEGVDKAPGEEYGKNEKVTLKDLKGKKNDADITDPNDEPAE